MTKRMTQNQRQLEQLRINNAEPEIQTFTGGIIDLTYTESEGWDRFHNMNKKDKEAFHENNEDQYDMLLNGDYDDEHYPKGWTYKDEALGIINDHFQLDFIQEDVERMLEADLDAFMGNGNEQNLKAIKLADPRFTIVVNNWIALGCKTLDDIDDYHDRNDDGFLAWANKNALDSNFERGEA